MVDATRYGADFQQPDDDGDHTPLRDLCRKAADGLTIIVEHEGEYTRQQPGIASMHDYGHAPLP